MNKNHHSYGIIPIYKKDNEIFICAVHNAKSNEWGLPKGTPESGETPFETAKRELQEETGITEFEIIGGKTFSEKYSFEQEGVNYNKENLYYIAETKEMIDKKSDIDSKDMKWINVKEVDDFFKFDTIKNVLNEVSEYLNKFPMYKNYHGRSGHDYVFEYYESDSVEHLPKGLVSNLMVLAFYKGNLLIVNNTTKPGTWGPVAGSIEDCESFEECLKRELREESNTRPIRFRLIGYQKALDKTDETAPIEYQLRYFAEVEKIGPFTPDCDPDGDVTELLEIDPKGYKKYFDFGEMGDVIGNRALEFLKNK